MVSLAVLAVTAALCAALGPGIAQADGGDPRTAYVVFTQWQSSRADPSTSRGALLTGVAGGDAGRGRYAMRILRATSPLHPRLWLGRVRYEFHGRGHAFVADVEVTENDQAFPITATLRGVVTQGWLKGARVVGTYGYWDVCPLAAPRGESGMTCFHGTLQLQTGGSIGGLHRGRA